MYRSISVGLALCVVVVLTGNVQAQLEVSWGGGDGRWDDENWDDGAGLDFIDSLVGQIDGSNGSSGPNGGDIITIASGIVEYPADDLGSDFRMKQGSSLVIKDGAIWTQNTLPTWPENRWTQMDLSELVLDGGTFRRTGAARLENPGDPLSGGALIFGSWRGNDNADTWLPNQETSILITNGGRLENEGSLWFAGSDDILPDSVFTMTIDNGAVDLTGGEVPPDTDFPFEGDLFFVDFGANPTFNVNFTGPGSITVDQSGIAIADFDDVRYVTYEDLWDEGILQANGLSGPDGEDFANYFTVTGALGEDDYTLAWRGDAAPLLQAGDADQDLDFDQFDIIKVSQSAKYLTGEAASWGEGDWDGAPGGSQGAPPPGNGLFDQLDIIRALSNGLYNTGKYAAIIPGGQGGDDQTSVVYDATTGEVSVDAPASTNLTSINIDSASGIFAGHEGALNLDGSFDTHSEDNIFKATFGSSFGDMSFGAIATPGLSEDMVAGDLTVIGSLEGGGGLGDVDLIYVPEPATALLLGLGLAGMLLMRRRRT